MPKICVKDHFLKGIPIKEDTVFHNQPIGIHYSDEYYKDPLEFRPERWQGECDSLPPFSLVGFSGGPRTCIGKHLAALQSKIGLIKFLQRYEKIELGVKEVELVLRLTYQPKSFKTRLTKSKD